MDFSEAYDCLPHDLLIAKLTQPNNFALASLPPFIPTPSLIMYLLNFGPPLLLWHMLPVIQS